MNFLQKKKTGPARCNCRLTPGDPIFWVDLGMSKQLGRGATVIPFSGHCLHWPRNKHMKTTPYYTMLCHATLLYHMLYYCTIYIMPYNIVPYHAIPYRTILVFFSWISQQFGVLVGHRGTPSHHHGDCATLWELTMPKPVKRMKFSSGEASGSGCSSSTPRPSRRPEAKPWQLGIFQWELAEDKACFFKVRAMVPHTLSVSRFVHASFLCKMCVKFNFWY